MSEENVLKREYDDDSLPQSKKIKVVTAWNKNEKLEERLNHILSCSVSTLLHQFHDIQLFNFLCQCLTIVG